MRTSRFSEQQIAFILKQADDGLSVEEVCRKAGISQQTYYLYGRLSRCKSMMALAA
ncbi:transposase [Limimaricola sp. G21655-S1]|jgi:putative transposase|uniref:transposase n=1 Tax=unclassified Limimaricola TaxID=2626459 RepID=UPI0022AF1587|nr:transposase [Limimaricola sp. G21655-S1]MCZ4262958.1 transposase [Limimaricola sp. G21655-S1]